MRRLAPVKRLTREQFLDRDPTLLSLIFHNPKKEIRKKKLSSIPDFTNPSAISLHSEHIEYIFYHKQPLPQKSWVTISALYP